MELLYKSYCYLFDTLKKVLGRKVSSNDISGMAAYLKLGTNPEDSDALWQTFINESVIKGFEFKGNLYAGYLADTSSWILPSWIWTNAAIVRCKCFNGKIDEAKHLGALLMKEQQECGGWIVRNDYDSKGAIPTLAPNDSAYIANNAFLSLFEVSGEGLYLDTARRCADWIIETARPDGMVYNGYNTRDKKWDLNYVIVDVGFTGGLFANLYKYTKDEKYKTFLETFIDRYITLFYNPQSKGFATSIDKNDHQQGGMFGRGQAWALEGLIPAYLVLKDERIKNVIEDTISNLLRIQCKDGGWSYNLSRPLMGEDCKAVSVIAKDMMEWYAITKDERIHNSAIRALEWCRKHTSIDGETKGGIFSFCYEGAIVHNLCSTCAFVYASAYAIELDQMLKK